MLNNATAMLLVVAALTNGTRAYAGDAVQQLLSSYRASGAGEFSAQRGEAMWTEVRGEGGARTCAACHNRDLAEPGRHARTGKAIEPLAPSLNPARLSDAAKVEKWFLRNCKDTWGRACTAQEKGDLLLYIGSQ